MTKFKQPSTITWRPTRCRPAPPGTPPLIYASLKPTDLPQPLGHVCRTGHSSHLYSHHLPQPQVEGLSPGDLMTEPAPPEELLPAGRAGQPEDVDQHIPDHVLTVAMAEAVAEHGESVDELGPVTP